MNWNGKMSENPIVMVDIGARYGLHPTWKNYKGNIEFHLIDADPKESLRLQNRYAEHSNVAIHSLMLAGREGKIDLDILKNPAMSGSAKRRNISPLFWGERSEQLEIQETLNFDATTLNKFRGFIGKKFIF